jgi:DNA invertase Pin-like site-specific DNA recombinase
MNKEEWKKLREEGFTYKEIAEKYDVTRQMIWKTLDSAGTPRKTKYSPYYEDWENLYRLGISTNKIAEKYGCPSSTVLRYLSKKVIIDAKKSALKAWKKKKKDMRKKKIQKPVTEIVTI